MRRIQLIIVGLTLMFMVTACSEKEQLQGDAVIDEAELSTFEKQFIDIVGSHPFLYDVTIENEDVSEVFLTIDYYKDGVKIGTINELHTPILDESIKLYRIAFFQQSLNDKEQNWTTAMMTNDGYTSMDGNHKPEGIEEMTSYASGGIAMPSSLYIGEKKVIATVVHSSKQAISIYNDISTEEQLKNATDYEHVYLISIELR